MKKTLNLALAVLLGLFAASCSSDSEKEDNIEFANSSQETSFAIEQTGATKTVAFTSANPWQASSDVNWIKVSPAQGEGGQATLTINVAANEDVDARSGNVNLVSGIVKKSFKISQVQKDALVVAEKRYEVGPEGKEIQIQFGTNVEVEAVSNMDWIHEKETKAYNEKSITFVVDALPEGEYDSRDGKILFSQKDGELKQEVTVCQAQRDAIIISDKVKEIPSEGGEFTIEISSNIGEENIAVEIDKGGMWLTEIDTRAMEKYSYSFKVTPNPKNDGREAKIIITNKKDDSKEEVIVRQMQKDGLFIGENVKDIFALGDEFSVAVTHNVKYEIAISEDWVEKAPETRGLVNTDETFIVKENPTEEARECTITFTSKDGKLSQMMTVKQGFITKKERVIREKLAKMYETTNGAEWDSGKTWCQPTPLGDWMGVSYENEVLRITLFRSGLSGKIDLSECPDLSFFEIGYDCVEELVLKNCDKLEQVSCYSSHLNKLDLGGCSKLVKVSCGDNSGLNYTGDVEFPGLETINLEGCKNLEVFSGNKNMFKTIDFTHSPKLRKVDISENNKLTEFKFAENNGIKRLACGCIAVENLDLSNCVMLDSLYCDAGYSGVNENLKSIDVSKCPKLSIIHISKNPNLSSLDLSKNKRVKDISCEKCGLTELKLNSTIIEKLFCDENKLTSIDLSKAIGIKTLHANKNKISELKLPELASNLSDLSMSDNKIDAIDISEFTALSSINLANNNLKSLDITNNDKLYSCIITGNEDMTEFIFDMSMNTNLHWIECKNTKINHEIPVAFDDVWEYVLEYEQRYTYSNGKVEDKGYGWWYPGEPACGEHKRQN